MSIKLVVSDIDGTLVNSEKELLPQTKNAIDRFIEKGGIFAIASGRPNKGIERYINELDLCNRGGYIISYNGSRITDLSTGKVVYQKNIEVKQVKEIIDIADSLGVPLTTYKDDIAVTQKANDKYFELEVSINKLEVKRTDNLLEEIKYPVPKFLITGEPEALEKAEKEMSERLKDVTVFRSEPFFLEITPKNMDKGVALRELGKYLKLDKSEIMACGDGYNDVALVKSAGIGVAMKNAQRPVLETADYITDSNENNGVGKAIEKFAL